MRNVRMAGSVIFPENQTSQQPYGNAGRSPLNIHGLPARQKTYQQERRSVEEGLMKVGTRTCLDWNTCDSPPPLAPVT